MVMECLREDIDIIKIIGREKRFFTFRPSYVKLCGILKTAIESLMIFLQLVNTEKKESFDQNTFYFIPVSRLFLDQQGNTKIMVLPRVLYLIASTILCLVALHGN